MSCRPAGSFFRLNGTSKPFGDFQVMAAGTGRGTSRNASRGARGTSSKRAMTSAGEAPKAGGQTPNGRMDFLGICAWRGPKPAGKLAPTSLSSLFSSLPLAAPASPPSMLPVGNRPPFPDRTVPKRRRPPRPFRRQASRTATWSLPDWPADPSRRRRAAGTEARALRPVACRCCASSLAFCIVDCSLSCARTRSAAVS